MACPICKGKKVVECPDCKGKGKKDGGMLVGSYTCKHCKGTGKVKCSCA
jgi:hypothetical protein